LDSSPLSAAGSNAGSGAHLTFIPDILEQHVEDLGFLWGQRQDALRSPDYTYAKFLELEDRIAAHLRGVLVVGERGLEWIERGLGSDDALEAFASGFSLLHLPNAALHERVLVAFETAERPRRDGLRHALRHCPAGDLARCERLMKEAPGPLAAAAAEVLVFQGRLELPADRLHAFVLADEAEVREAGWRLVAYTIAPMEPKVFATGLRDEDPRVKRAAMHAAAWSGLPGVMMLARDATQEFSTEQMDELTLLAILGTPQDAPVLDAIARSNVLGAAGLQLLASLGHPGTIGAIVEAMQSPDPAIAAAAGAAFTRMTGIDVTSTATAKLPAESGQNEFEAEFQEEVALPDPALAARRWQELGPRLAGATRIACGFDLGREFTSETFQALDMASRWEVCLRARFHGVWSGSPLWLERYPQRS
jgi:uncharacterized protein (TIGR02270 family)